MPKILATDKRWSSLYKFGTIADPQLKSALADSDVLAKYMDGDFTQYQALKKEIEVAQKAIQVTLASAPKRKKPLAPKTTRKPKERYSQGATYVGVKSNLVFRLAEIEEANLTRLVRQALVPFAWQWTDVAMSKREAAELNKHKEAFVSDFGLKDGRELSYSLDAIERCESGVSESNPRVLRRIRSPGRGTIGGLKSSASQIFSYLEDWVGSPRCPHHIRRAFLEAPWRQDPFSKLLGVLKLDESEDTTDQYPYSLERGYLHAVDVAARCVAAKYNWTVSGAVGFLLANWAPISKVAKVEYRINEIDQKPACTSTITLTVDATLSPEEVMAIYAKSRRDILPYHRSLQQKSLNLANHVFSQTFIGTPRDPGPQATEQEISHFWNEWKYLLERWNEEVDLYGITGSKNEDAKYSKPSMFRDHAYRARDLLIFPSLENPEKTVVYPNLKEIGLKP